MTQVFLSHSSEDAEFASWLADRLRKNGITVWKVPESVQVGEPKAAARRRGLETSSHFVLLISQAAVKDSWVDFEFNSAIELEREQQIVIIPIDYKPADIAGNWKFYPATSLHDKNDALVWSLIAKIQDKDIGNPSEPTADPTINVYVEGDAHGDINVGGRDMHSQRSTSPTGLTEIPHPTLGMDQDTIGRIIEIYRDPDMVTMPSPISKTLHGLRSPQGFLSMYIVWICVVSVLLIVLIILNALTNPNTINRRQEESSEFPTEVSITLTVEPSEASVVESTITSAETPPSSAATSTDQGALIFNDRTRFIQPFDGIEMARVPSGCFPMGSENGEDDESPVHEVCFQDPYWIDVYEVTNEQYGSTNPFLDCNVYSSEPQQPVNCVTWNEAAAFCEGRGARLPTEAEWEYAARGPDMLVYPWGNEFEPLSVVYGKNSNNRTALVGSRENGVSWVGAYDMSGNVWEWVSDWYAPAYYSDSPSENPQGPEDGTNRVLRGGSGSADSFSLRSANRYGNGPAIGYGYIGFRCVRDYQQ